MIPVRNDNATTTCDLCGERFTPIRRQRWCSDACRQAAWRRADQPPAQPSRPAPTPSPNAPTVKPHSSANSTATRRLGAGGTCPHCLLTEQRIA